MLQHALQFIFLYEGSLFRVRCIILFHPFVIKRLAMVNLDNISNEEIHIQQHYGMGTKPLFSPQHSSSNELIEIFHAYDHYRFIRDLKCNPTWV